jgi:hypothetical protein
MCDAIELIVMTPSHEARKKKRKPFLDNFAAYSLSLRTAEPEGVHLGCFETLNTSDLPENTLKIISSNTN